MPVRNFELQHILVVLTQLLNCNILVKLFFSIFVSLITPNKVVLILYAEICTIPHHL